MKVALTSTGPDLDAAPTWTFGRCAWFIFIDTETGEQSSVQNPAADAAGGAGVQAAQLVVDRGVDTVLTGRVGPHAMDVLSAAGIRILDIGDDDARTAVNRLGKGNLTEITNASAPRGVHGRGGRGAGGGGGGGGGGGRR